MKSFVLPKRSLREWIVAVLLVAFGVFSLFMDMVNGGGHPWYPAIQYSYTRNAQTICDALGHYAHDHGGKFPDGKCSTEVFQKLLDEKYVEVSPLFYRSFPGKTEPNWDQRLTPQNVSWDVTSGVTEDSPGSTPLVILTGFHVRYVPGTPGEPYIKPYPKLFYALRTVQGWFHGEPDPTPYAATVVCCKDGHAVFVKLDTTDTDEGKDVFVTSSDFKPDGKTYRQLTPDGVLPP